MRELINFAYPVILSRFVQTLGLVIGNLFVAQLGSTALAASALATSISIAFFTFSNGCLFSLGPQFAACKKIIYCFQSYYARLSSWQSFSAYL
ncbi:MATE family efflux transporter [Piscirickettsia litoralis]|uniref:MATE family efflux transporter n=1 Tax=Piscirickettsia litoralis TaxID=1891921 RepID=UPI000981305F|nr:MATE family efflux transporter [Piscirickettsia litoralis]